MPRYNEALLERRMKRDGAAALQRFIVTSHI